MRSGVGLLMLAMCLTPGIDGLSKHLGASHSALSVSFLRYLAAGLVALMIARLTGQPIHVPREGRLGQVLRTAILMGAMTCLIGALAVAPMATAAGGFLVAPLVATVIGIFWLGERITLPKLLGMGLSVTGAALILRPETGVSLGALLALGGGALLGVYLTATRSARHSGGTLATLAVQCLLGAALLFPLALIGGLPALSPLLLAQIAALGGLSALAHFLTVAAFEREQSSTLAPFLYFNLVAALVAGYLLFSELPGLWSMAGLTLIAAGGLATLLPPHRCHVAIAAMLQIQRRAYHATRKRVTGGKLPAILTLFHSNGGDHDGYVASERTQA